MTTSLDLASSLRRIRLELREALGFSPDSSCRPTPILANMPTMSNAPATNFFCCARTMPADVSANLSAGTCPPSMLIGGRGDAPIAFLEDMLSDLKRKRAAQAAQPPISALQGEHQEPSMCEPNDPSSMLA